MARSRTVNLPAPYLRRVWLDADKVRRTGDAGRRLRALDDQSARPGCRLMSQMGRAR